jgi:hypothetical protein
MRAGEYARDMDRLEVRLAPHEDKDIGRWVAVDLLVNGENLKAFVASFEQARGFEPVGGYDSISLEGLQPAAARLTGSPNSWPGNGETVLLVCEGCREEGCWPIFARVDLFEEVVEWSAFRQPHRPDRDYTDLHFTFDRRHYDAEIRLAFSQA